MKNILILGSGRSGTSMVAGCLAKAGYNMGDDYIFPRNSNPKGFFEDSEVNSINEEILFKSYPKKNPFLGEWINDIDIRVKPRWLARVPLNVRLFSSNEIEKRIKEVVKKKPFCYKDTRFGYTLPVWKAFLEDLDVVFICIFRYPASTARSILRECRDMEYLKNMPVDFEYGLDVWKLVYSHILKHLKEDKKIKKKNRWLFLHYNQLFDKKGLERLKRFTKAKIDESFPDKKLKKPEFRGAVSDDLKEIYEELCKLASYDE